MGQELVAITVSVCSNYHIFLDYASFPRAQSSLVGGFPHNSR